MKNNREPRKIIDEIETLFKKIDTEIATTMAIPKRFLIDTDLAKEIESKIPQADHSLDSKCYMQLEIED